MSSKKQPKAKQQRHNWRLKKLTGTKHDECKRCGAWRRQGPVRPAQKGNATVRPLQFFDRGQWLEGRPSDCPGPADTGITRIGSVPPVVVVKVVKPKAWSKRDSRPKEKTARRAQAAARVAKASSKSAKPRGKPARAGGRRH